VASSAAFGVADCELRCVGVLARERDREPFVPLVRERLTLRRDLLLNDGA
jgi:hypothetical protein